MTQEEIIKERIRLENICKEARHDMCVLQNYCKHPNSYIKNLKYKSGDFYHCPDCLLIWRKR